MNIYFWGMCLSFSIHIVIGLYISRKVKSAEDNLHDRFRTYRTHNYGCKPSDTSA